MKRPRTRLTGKPVHNHIPHMLHLCRLQRQRCRSSSTSSAVGARSSWLGSQGHTVLMLVFTSAKVLPEQGFLKKMENLNNAGLYASNRHTPLHVCLPSPQACDECCRVHTTKSLYTTCGALAGGRSPLAPQCGQHQREPAAEAVDQTARRLCV